MAQVFRPRSNTIALAIIVGGLLFLAALVYGTYAVWDSPYMTRVNIPQDQPVQFSHEHHVAGLGIDCRYCHTSVETESFAGMPPTETCMTCHSQVWVDAPMLAPVRQSLARQMPLQWNRVNDLPDFVYFDHAIHVQRGVACVTCHGRVDQMPLMWKATTQYMQWCLDCHRNPAPYLAPREQVFNLGWTSPSNQLQLGQQRMREANIDPDQITNCSACHH
ncbi:MAG TPA: cytochrome c3 family protein [Clostridia bacterium]|nr:cytochrome c3 family protein [Clostridia bacterium]